MGNGHDILREPADHSIRTAVFGSMLSQFRG